MTTQGRALDKMRQGFQGKFALDNDRGIGFLDKLHISIGFGTENARTSEIALARKNELVSYGLDLNAI